MFDVITFGSASKDIFLRPKKITLLKYNKDKTSDGREVCFALGSKVDVEEMESYSGGGGTNAASTFTLQGLKTAFCGAVGKDTAGKEIIEELKKLKINTNYVVEKKEKATNSSVIILDSQYDRTILAYRGASELLTKKEIPWKKLKAKWLYIAPLSGLLCDSFEELVNFAFENNIKVAANPGMAQLSLPNFSEIAKKISVLILNQEEASFLTKIPYQEEQKIFEKIDELCPGILVMTKGGEGVVVSDGKQIYFAKPVSQRVIADTTGAGDAFGSGFVVEFMRSSDIEKSIQFGMANSIGCISQIGAKNGLLKKGQEFEKISVLLKS